MGSATPAGGSQEIEMYKFWFLNTLNPYYLRYIPRIDANLYFVTFLGPLYWYSAYQMSFWNRLQKSFPRNQNSRKAENFPGSLVEAVISVGLLWGLQNGVLGHWTERRRSRNFTSQGPSLTPKTMMLPMSLSENQQQLREILVESDALPDSYTWFLAVIS